MSDFLKSLLLISCFIIIVNYEWKRYNNTVIISNKPNYAKMLADNFINKISALEHNQAKILEIIIDKFSQLNVITQNTGKGQALILQLYLYLQNINADDNDDNDDNNEIANEIINSEEVLIAIIYPHLI